MIYRIYTYEGKEGAFFKREEYDNQESADKKIAKSYKNKKSKVVAIPETIGVGYKIYVKGEHYATIIRETDNFYYANRVNRGEDDEIFLLKAEFEDKFIKGTFDSVE